MPTYTTNYNLIMPLPLNPVDANIWGPMLNNNISFQDSYSLSLANNFIGNSAPTIPVTGLPSTGQFWINNTTAGSWPISVFDGSQWVSMGVLNSINHTFYTSARSVKLSVISSSQAFSLQSSTNYVQVIAIGGGGGGGGSSSTTQFSAGGGGGAGGYSMMIVTAINFNSPQTITIGAAGTGNLSANGGVGGDTTVGSILTGKGGTGGVTGTSTASIGVSGTGGAGGIAGTGGFTPIITTPGQAGTGGVIYAINANGGTGGTSTAGYGAGGAGVIVAGNGAAGAGFGAGGAGAVSTIAAGHSGGAGAPGVVIIIEYS